MEVHRSLPQRALPMVGAWCFLDRFGPQTARMRVEPHPHIGLQTVTWPLVGEVRHRDTLGNDVVVRRGVLNLMTSGAGIAHSEYSLGEDAVPLDALQLWVALPRRAGTARRSSSGTRTCRPSPSTAGRTRRRHGDGRRRRLRRRALARDDAHADRRRRDPRARRIACAPLDPVWEYALVGVAGCPRCTPRRMPRPPSPTRAAVPRHPSRRVEVSAQRETTLFLIGGEPFESDIVMWWNFVGRSR
jgi:redox-sensitive bicupin YhaK (pirin superfamily)